jgi:hypothetical protein
VDDAGVSVDLSWDADPAGVPELGDLLLEVARRIEQRSRGAAEAGPYR